MSHFLPTIFTALPCLAWALACAVVCSIEDGKFKESDLYIAFVGLSLGFARMGFPPWRNGSQKVPQERLDGCGHGAKGMVYCRCWGDDSEVARGYSEQGLAVSREEALWGGICANGRKSWLAFSLIELLLVMGVIGLLSVASVPVVRNMTVGRGCANGAAMVEQAFERARAEAVSRQTYVYVLLGSFPEEGMAPLAAGHGKLAVFLAASLDGSPLSASLVESNCNIVGKLATVSGVAMDAVTSISGGLNRPNGSGVADFVSQPVSGSATLYPLSGESRYSFQVPVIEFSPQGTARIAGAGDFPQFIEIGLKPARGGTVQTDAADVAVVQLSGITGKTTIYRP